LNLKTKKEVRKKRRQQMNFRPLGQATRLVARKMETRPKESEPISRR
jgi:hypothetical protein